MILAILKPFELTQKLFIFKDGVMVNQLDTSIDTAHIDILALAELNDATEVQFSGTKSYCQKVESRIKKLELRKYNENKLKFIYI